MDPKVKLALEAIAMELQATDPLAYGNIAAFLAGREGLKADTLIKLRPLLQRAGISLTQLQQAPAGAAGTAVETQAVNDPLRGGSSTIGQTPLSQPETGGRTMLGRGTPEGMPAHNTTLSPAQILQNAAKNALPPGGGGTPGVESVPQGGMRPGGGTLPGGFTAAQGGILSEDDNQLIRFALQAAGLNPDRMGKFGQIAAKMLAPLVAARRNAFGIADGSNVGGLPQDIASFAKEFTTPGADFFGNAANYARQTMGSGGFTNAVNALGNPDQQIAMYQSLLPLLFGGSNPLIQQAAADTSQRTAAGYNDATFNASGVSPNEGIFSAWLNSQPNLDPLQRSIFGLQR
jgi:hypothetical protein